MQKSRVWTLLATFTVLIAFETPAMAIEWPPVLSSDPQVQPPKWDWQLDVPVQLNADEGIEIYDIDMFDNESNGKVGELQSYGKKVICYVDVGSWEDFRDDVDDFPESILGAEYYGFPDERWLDIRDVNPEKSSTGTALARILRARFDRAMNMGCDGVEPDNMDVYDETAHEPSGFPLTYEDQIYFNLWVADEVHQRGMAVGLKNDINQAGDPRIVNAFDFVVSEECVQYDECSYFSSFIDAGKPVFLAEYDYQPEQFCEIAKDLRISAIKKRNSLDSFRVGCDSYYEDNGGSLETPIPISPVDQVVVARQRFSVTWEAQAAASSYSVEFYDRNVAAWSQQSTYDADTICDEFDCSIRWPAMREQRRSFWRVKATNSNGSSDWSNYSDGVFDVAEEYKPSLPVLLSPLGGDTLEPDEPVALSWRKVDSATRYYVQRYDRQTDSWSYSGLHLADEICDNTSCSVITPALAEQANAFWRVRADNSQGISGFTDYRDTLFDVSYLTAPPKVQLISPINRAVVAPDTAVTLVFSSAGTATRYHVQRFDRIAFRWTYSRVFAAADICDSSQCSVSVPGIGTQNLAYWRVKSSNSAGSSGYTDFRDAAFDVRFE